MPCQAAYHGKALEQIAAVKQGAEVTHFHGNVQLSFLSVHLSSRLGPAPLRRATPADACSACIEIAPATSPGFALTTRTASVAACIQPPRLSTFSACV